MEITFSGKVALVTGGARGIGRAIVEGFARSGAETLFTYANSATASEELVETLQGEGCKVHAYKVDSSDTDAVGDFIASVQKEFGGIDVLVNNAGIIRDTLIMMMSKEHWNQVINTNLTGIYNTVKPVSKVMMRKKAGAIVNISSVVATKAGRGHANYAASKGGVEALTRALAAELGLKNIRVNCVAPGMIATDMSQAVRDAAGDQVKEAITLKRFGTPEDIAQAVLFLCSDAASYITGQVLTVDGGFKGFF